MQNIFGLPDKKLNKHLFHHFPPSLSQLHSPYILFPCKGSVGKTDTPITCWHCSGHPSAWSCPWVVTFFLLVPCRFTDGTGCWAGHSINTSPLNYCGRPPAQTLACVCLHPTGLGVVDQAPRPATVNPLSISVITSLWRPTSDVFVHLICGHGDYWGISKQRQIVCFHLIYVYVCARF